MTLLLHIGAGVLGLGSGFLALYAGKGRTVHRKSGLLFVCAMSALAVSGTLIAAVQGIAPGINVPAGLLTAYLVITALATVRPMSAWSRRFDVALLLIALVVGVSTFGMGVEAVTSGGQRRGLAFPFFMFGTIGLLGGAGDLRMLRYGAFTGARRLARHLWRMCIALFIASLSFFIGQADVLPKQLRIYPLLALPMLLVFGTMLFWLWRVGRKRKPRGRPRVSEGRSPVAPAGAAV
jgi:hypothetical protein